MNVVYASPGNHGVATAIAVRLAEVVPVVLAAEQGNESRLKTKSKD